jgi:hypothetical protein
VAGTGGEAVDRLQCLKVVPKARETTAWKGSRRYREILQEVTDAG